MSGRTTRAHPIRSLLFLFPLAVAAVLLHGYHPYVVDASIYVTGIEKSIYPGLFAKDIAFVAVHAKFSAFSMLMAKLQMASGLPLEWLLLLTYTALIFGFLLLCYMLGERMFASRAGGWSAALLAAVCMPVPVAATSLLLIDPYLSARSFSTDLSLLTILACLRGRWWSAVICCVATAVFHPLMSVYLGAFLLIYFLVLTQSWRLVGAACALAFALCGAIVLLTRHTEVSASYRVAVLSRPYYFPGLWHWYEIAGLVMPMLLLGLVWRKAGVRTDLGRVACTCVIVGAVSLVCCLCFVHPAGPYFLARLQLLRSYHTIYALGTVMLGGTIARYCAGRQRYKIGGLVALIAVAAGMFLMQRDEYRTLPDVEWPDVAVANNWEAGFRWIRANTPQSALFAMDPHLVDFEDEAMPGFRAIAERSILTDVKDEGLASLFPELAPVWSEDRGKQQVLEAENDDTRRKQLAGTGANWIILGPAAVTRLACPYRNAAMRVCSLTQQ